jgi:hypothetical protein
MISWESIARAALDYMSEDDVADLAHCEFDMDPEEEEEEEEEEPDDGRAPLYRLAIAPAMQELFGEDELRLVRTVAWDKAGWEKSPEAPYIFYAWLSHADDERDLNKVWRRCRFQTEKAASDFAHAVMAARGGAWNLVGINVWQLED